jgi:hypothetical protein
MARSSRIERGRHGVAGEERISQPQRARGPAPDIITVLARPTSRSPRRTLVHLCRDCNSLLVSRGFSSELVGRNAIDLLDASTYESSMLASESLGTWLPPCTRSLLFTEYSKYLTPHCCISIGGQGSGSFSASIGSFHASPASSLTFHSKPSLFCFVFSRVRD